MHRSPSVAQRASAVTATFARAPARLGVTAITLDWGVKTIFEKNHYFNIFCVCNADLRYAATANAEKLVDYFIRANF